ncbi:MAG: RAMP superfamily CRISPR-associated protein [Candidatus Vecturithrix sp.]|jgi:CRISPR-associated protein Csx10|nr:RAMP superfamily CRISPR-associated protein [Candidatus Vecturithrix sp.]
MTNYKLKLELCSPTLVGSGEGFGALIDTDVVFDDVGIPYIPAKRIKGCLRDAALDAQDMLELTKTMVCLEIDRTFGIPGDMTAAPVYFSNLTIPEYCPTYEWLKYLLKSKKYPTILSPSQIVKTFTELRQQTKINEDGTAEDGSLRTSRIIKTGYCFYGEIAVNHEDADQRIRQTLLLACLNFRAFGTKRTRGFGEMRCLLLDDQGNDIVFPETLEALLCTP